MIEFLVLGGLMAAGLAFAALLGIIFLVVRLAIWVVFLPFRLLLKLLLWPIWLAVGAVGLALGAAAIPVILTVGIAVLALGAVAALVAMLIPAIPFVLFGLLIWAFLKSRPAAA